MGRLSGTSECQIPMDEGKRERGEAPNVRWTGPIGWLRTADRIEN